MTILQRHLFIPNHSKDWHSKHGYIQTKRVSSMLLLFYYLAPLQNDALVMSHCTAVCFGGKREARLQDESALHVNEKVSNDEKTA